MTERKTYRASVERDGAWWYIFVEDIGHSTQARRLDEVEGMVRDLIALVEDVAADSFDVDITVRSRRSVGRRDARGGSPSERSGATPGATGRNPGSSHRSARSGLPFRDNGDLRGLSHQRITSSWDSHPMALLDSVEAATKASRETVGRRSIGEVAREDPRPREQPMTVTARGAAYIDDIQRSCRPGGRRPPRSDEELVRREVAISSCFSSSSVSTGMDIDARTRPHDLAHRDGQALRPCSVGIPWVGGNILLEDHVHAWS